MLYVTDISLYIMYVCHTRGKEGVSNSKALKKKIVKKTKNILPCQIFFVPLQKF